MKATMDFIIKDLPSVLILTTADQNFKWFAVLVLQIQLMFAAFQILNKFWELLQVFTNFSWKPPIISSFLCMFQNIPQFSTIHVLLIHISMCYWFLHHDQFKISVLTAQNLYKMLIFKCFLFNFSFLTVNTSKYTSTTALYRFSNHLILISFKTNHNVSI